MGFGDARAGQSLKPMNHFWVHAKGRVHTDGVCARAQAFGISEREVDVSDLQEKGREVFEAGIDWGDERIAKIAPHPNVVEPTGPGKVGMCEWITDGVSFTVSRRRFVIEPSAQRDADGGSRQVFVTYAQQCCDCQRATTRVANDGDAARGFAFIDESPISINHVVERCGVMVFRCKSVVDETDPGTTRASEHFGIEEVTVTAGCDVRAAMTQK